MGLLEAWEGEGTWDEGSRNRVRGRGRLYRVKRAAVICRGLKLVALRRGVSLRREKGG